MIPGVIEPDQLIPSSTILSLENAACLIDPESEGLYLEVPRKIKYSKVYLYNRGNITDEDEREVLRFCEELSDEKV